jgi:hypothetical protein
MASKKAKIPELASCQLGPRAAARKMGLATDSVPLFEKQKSQHPLTLNWQMWLAAIYLSSPPFASLLPEALSMMGERLSLTSQGALLVGS